VTIKSVSDLKLNKWVENLLRGRLRRRDDLPLSTMDVLGLSSDETIVSELPAVR